MNPQTLKAATTEAERFLELLQTFYQACNAEGGTADEIYLRGIRAVLAARPTAPPAPEVGEVGLLVDRLNQVAGDFDFLCNKIVNGECRTLACLRRGGYDDGLCRARGIKPPDPLVATCPALEKAGAMRRAATLLQQLSAPAPAVVSVAVSERLPDRRPESEGGDCDAEGRCWWFSPGNQPAPPSWTLDSEAMEADTHWRPSHVIPLPQAGEVG